MERKTAKVMWTGGLDSTLRVLQLSYLDIDIQPYYVYVKKRITRDKEIDTVNQLSKMISNRETTKANILPLIILDLEEFKPYDSDIVEAYKRLIKTQHISIQNIMLAQVTRKIKDIEISFEKTRNSDKYSIVDNISSLKGLKKITEDYGEVYYYVTEETGKDVYTLFKDYKFPEKIITITKEEEILEFKKLDAMDIAEKTWFCQNPVNDEPCGYCLVCRNTVKELGDWRLTKAGKKRLKHWRYHLLMHKIKKATNLILKGQFIKYFYNKYK